MKRRNFLYKELDLYGLIDGSLKDCFISGNIICLTGDLGAGKTTLVKCFMQYLGYQGYVSSPTYTYLNIYELTTIRVHHFDLYRISSADEFLILGFQDFLYDNSALVIVEWPEVIQPLLDKCKVVHINISHNRADSRSMTVSYNY